MQVVHNAVSQQEAVNANLTKIEKQLFEVVKVPLMAQPNFTIRQFLTNPKAVFVEWLRNPFYKSPVELYGVYRKTGGSSLGVMGSQFVPMQPKEFYNNIVATVNEFGADLDLTTLQFKEYCGGSKIEFSIKMYPLSFKNDKGLNDVTNLEVTFSTSFDGSKSNVISLYTERLVCLNGMVANKLQGTLKGRNTLNGKAKILSYTKELAEIVNGANEFKEKMEALDKIKLSNEQIETFKLSLLGFNRESLRDSDKPETRKHTMLDELDEAINIEFERTGQTAFGLLQGVTYYTNHMANTSKTISDSEYIRFNQGFKTNEKAQEILFELVA